MHPYQVLKEAIAHGSKSSEIILEDNEGNSKPVPASALSDLFSLLKGNIQLAKIFKNRRY